MYTGSGYTGALYWPFSARDMLFFAVGGFAILAAWAIALTDWRRLTRWVLWFMPFTGIPVILSDHNVLSLLLKDIMFFIPLYLSFFIFNLRYAKTAHVPKTVLAAMLFLGVLVMLQSLNPAIPNVFVGVIGAKVWLFYMPFSVVVAAAITEPQDHFRLLRIMTALSVIPCTVGLLEWFLSMAIGYENAMTVFYGSMARDMTQNFAKFDYGSGFYRIPSTFTFSTQYFGFLLAMVVVTYIVKETDPSPKWRHYGRLAFYYVVVASFLSGSRSAFLFIPLLVALLYLIDGRLSGMLAGLVLMPILLFTVLDLGGVNPLQILGVTDQLTGDYGTTFVLEAPIMALEQVPYGLGTGMNTGPARYLFPGERMPIDNLSFNIESYYVKAMVELGVPGPIAVILLFAALIAAGLHSRSQTRDRQLKTAVSAYTAFVILMTINSIKGWQLDVDPLNVYYWVFAGAIFKLPYLKAAPVRAPKPQRVPAFRYRVPVGRPPVVPRLPR
jgi:hypothetical protein